MTIKEILNKAEPRSEIIKYYFKRIFGIKSKLNNDVYINHKGIVYNCGRTMDQVKCVLSDEVEDIRIDEEMVDKTIIDVGANVGVFTILFSKYVGSGGKVIAIEPSKENFKLLKENMSSNSINNSYIKDIGCSDKKEIKTFYQNNKYPTGNTTKINSDGYTKIEDLEETKINVDTIDNICKYEKNIGLIKIDTGGTELEVLKGAVKTIEEYKPIIIFEAWTDRDAAKINLFLSKFNYCVKHIGHYNYMAYQNDNNKKL